MTNSLEGQIDCRVSPLIGCHLRTSAWCLALVCLSGSARAELELIVSQPEFSGVWRSSRDSPMRAKLWVHETEDQSLAIGGVDDRSTFSATCAISEAKRATCQGTGLAINFSDDVAQPPHRFLYKSELSLSGSALKEVWEIWMLWTPEEQKKAGKHRSTVKGEFLYEQRGSSSSSR